MTNLTDAEGWVFSVEDKNAKRALQALIAECKRLADIIDETNQELDRLKGLG
jgi:hypothetical protein